MKKIAIMQPYLLPYIGYFQVMSAVDEYVIYDDVNYIKGGWINRNNILTNGDKRMFTFGVFGASSNKRINELELTGDYVNFQKVLSDAYIGAPYEIEVQALISRICAYESNNLALFVGNSLREVANYIGITTKIVYSSDLKKDVNLRGQEKVIAICKELSADMYINAIGGQELYSKEEFFRQGISLNFLKTIFIEYKQFDNNFIPGLSIIDLLMFNPVEKIRHMLESYELV